MDIILDRILSLLPKKPDGKYVRGSKKEFAQKIGYDSGDIVSMWISGESASYKKKLHEISAVYGVSVEWLKGETDHKEKPTGKTNGFRIEDITQEEIQSLSTRDLALLIARLSEEMGCRE